MTPSDKLDVSLGLLPCRDSAPFVKGSRAFLNCVRTRQMAVAVRRVLMAGGPLFGFVSLCFVFADG